jgi:hypothetical protein
MGRKKSKASTQLIADLILLPFQLVGLAARLLYWVLATVMGGLKWMIAKAIQPKKRSNSYSAAEPEWLRQKKRRQSLPPPPSLEEYAAAGVNPDVCTLCQKRMPERQREWRYLLFENRPTIICPNCWRKNVTNATNQEATAFEARVVSKVWNTPRLPGWNGYK